jgi:hypothetical protein
LENKKFGKKIQYFFLWIYKKLNFQKILRFDEKKIVKKFSKFWEKMVGGAGGGKKAHV